MMTAISLISAICMGVLAGSTRTPDVRIVPACSCAVVALMFSTALVVADPGTVLVLSCLALFVIAMTTYSALVWRAVLGKDELPFMTAVAYSFIGEKHLRARYAGLNEPDVAEAPAPIG